MRTFPEGLLSLIPLISGRGEEPQATHLPVLFFFFLIFLLRGWTLGGNKVGWTEAPSTEMTAGATPTAELVQLDIDSSDTQSPLTENCNLERSTSCAETDL